MRKLLLITGLLLFGFCAQAQINAVTENGEKVILKPDGTWTYADGETPVNKPIPLSEEKFEKGSASTFLVKSRRMKVGLWINPKQWSFEKGKESEPAEFTFKRKEEDLYGMLIAEKIEIPIESLRSIAIDNAREAAPDLRVTSEEYRMVNGVQVLMMQMKGTIQGIRFVYFGYYHSSPEGSVQLLTYTSDPLFERYRSDMEDLLNGYVLTDK